MNNSAIRTEQPREKWIDCLKGLAILLVIWGHTQEYVSFLNTWVQTFHVSIFLLVSGYLFQEHNKKSDTYVLTAKRMIKTYVFFSIIAIILNSFFNAFDLKSILIDIYKTITLYGIHALWYLPSYTLAVFVVLRIKSGRTRCLLSILFIGVSIAYNAFYLRFNWPSRDIFDLFYYPTSAIIRSLSCAAIISLGYEVNTLFKIAKKYQIVLLSILCITISLVFSRYTTNSFFSLVNYYPHPMFLYLCALTGSFGFMSLFYIMSKLTNHLRFLQYCSKNSLILLVTHSTFKLIDLSAYIVRKLSFLPNNHIIKGSISLILIILMEIPIILVFTKTRLKRIIS